MRLKSQSLAPIDTKVESKKLMQNYRVKVDAILFSGCETINMDVVRTLSLKS